MSPSKDHRLNIRLSDQGRANIEALAEAAGGSMTKAIDSCLPSPELIPGLVAAARFGRGLADETATLLLAGMVGRIDEAKLGVTQALHAEQLIRDGNTAGIVRVYSQLVEAQSSAPSRRYSLVPVEGDNGMAIVPLGWSAKQIGARLEITPPTGTTLDSVIRALRSDRREARLRAAVTAATCLGAGLGQMGASEMDLEFGVGRDLGALLERAVEGDGSAVDILETMLTENKSHAAGTPIESAERGVYVNIAQDLNK